MAAPAVEVAGLTKRYGETLALDALTFQAPAGHVTALLGPNGAGKTTTVEICEGFRAADDGTVKVLGLPPRSSSLKVRVGVMPQDGGLPPAARAGEAVRTAAALHADPVRPDYLLRRLGLDRVARTTCRRLSGGERQRLSLALAIVGRPEMVFLDEPTAGLDPHARHAIWELVEELRANGVSVVLTTHYMEDAARLADHVVIIDHGRVVASGHPDELASRGAERQLRFQARPGLDLDQLLSALPPGTTAKESPAGHYLVEGEVGPHLLAAVTAWCASHDVLAADLRIESRTLEDVFLDMTGRTLRS